MLNFKSLLRGSCVYLQVLAALGTEYFENILPDIIRNCSHQRASVRDGYLTVFKVSIAYL